MAEGTEADIDRVGSLLKNRGVEEQNVYDMEGNDRTEVNTSFAPMNR